MLIGWKEFKTLPWDALSTLVRILPLSDKSKKVLRAVYLDNLPIGEIAKRINVSEQRVRVVFYEAFAEMAFYIISDVYALSSKADKDANNP